MNQIFISVVSAAIFLLAATTHGVSENVGAVRCRDGNDCFIRSRCFPASVCKLFDVCMGKNQSKELCEKNAVNAAGDVMKAGGIRPKRFVPSTRMKSLLLAKKLSKRRRSLKKKHKPSSLRTTTRRFRKKLAVGALRNRKRKTNKRRDFPKVKRIGFWGRRRRQLRKKLALQKALRNRMNRRRNFPRVKRRFRGRKRKRYNNRPKIKKQKMTYEKKWQGQLAAALKKTHHSYHLIRKQSNALASTLRALRHVRKGISISPPRPKLRYRLTYSFVPPKKDAGILFTLLDWQAINKGAKDIYRLADKHKKLLTKYGKWENESVFHFLKRKNAEMAFRSPFTRKVHEIYKRVMKKGRTGWFVTRRVRKSRAKKALRKALQKRKQYTKTRYYQVKAMLLRK